MLKICPRCGEPVPNPRKKFCTDQCKYRFNSIKKDKERGMPPVRKRTDQYFSMVIGSGYPPLGGSRQGRRSGGMITGGMSARIQSAIEEIVPVTEENLRRHFKGIPGYLPTSITLGNGERVRKDDIFKTYNIQL